MRFNTGIRSIAALAMIIAAANTTLAGGRRTVYYIAPQASNRSVQQFPHDDALNELQSQSDRGSRSLQPNVMALDARLSALEGRLGVEQRNVSSVVVTREFRNDQTGVARGDRAGGTIIAQILFNVLGALKQIDASPTHLNGLQKTDILSQALKPLLDQILSQNSASTQQVEADHVVPAATVTAEGDLEPLIKLTEELKAAQEALKKYEKEYKAEQERQMELQKKREELRKAAKEALKKVSDDLKKASE